MRQLALGGTGLTVSEFGFGGIPLIRLDQEEATRVVRHAYDHGVTLYDTANRYLDSEDKIGRALKGVRDKVVLATKTGQREAGLAMEELTRSLKLLRTDWIDIYQLHQISQQSELDAALAPGGVYEAVAKARDKGLIRHIGVSSHNLDMAVSLVESGLFTTIQYPLNFIEDEALERLYPLARAAGMGILVMKPFAGGMIDNARAAFGFLRQHPDAIPLPGFDSTERVDEVLDIYNAPNQAAPETLALMERYRTELGGCFCRRCEYCQPCPQGVSITYAMMYKVVSLRMSPAKAVGFSGKIMETVRNCEDCGQCEAKCPYGLPIPEMLREYLALYDRHRQEEAQ